MCDLALLVVGVAAVVVDGGATPSKALVVSYLLSVVYFVIFHYNSTDNSLAKK